MAGMPAPVPADWHARGQRVLARPCRPVNGAPVERALNAELWTRDGRRHIDFSARAGVIGHRHPQVVAAMLRELRDPRSSQACAALEPDAIRLAERLAVLPDHGPTRRVALHGSDAEALESAVMLARRYTGRPALLAFSGSTHGHSHLTLALSGRRHSHKAAGGAYPSYVHHLPFPHASLGVSLHETRRAFELLTQATIASSDIAAIVIEPIQRDGGILPCSAELLSYLRDLCDAHGIILVADETRSAPGLSGRLLASGHFAAEPDLIVMGGPLAGGMPLAAMIGKAVVMDSVPDGLSTGEVNTLALAAAHAVLDVVEQTGLCERAIALGRHWTDRMHGLAPTRLTLDVRGLGAMRGVELRDSAGAPAAAQAHAICDACREQGLILQPAGPKDNVVPFLFPLTTELAVLDEALDIFADALRRAGN